MKSEQACRIIPCLDVTAGRVVKGVNFVDLVDAGDPVEIARRYDEQGADELTLLDITATTENRDVILPIVTEVAKNISIPLTVGGGVRDLSDVQRLMDAGATRVSINSAAISNPDLVRSASDQFGKDSIIVAIDARQTTTDAGQSSWEIYTHGGKRATGIDAIEWAQRMQEMGAGALLVTSMDKDGTKSGFDLALTRAISDAVSIPVIASGGVGSLQDLADGVLKGGAAAVLAASIFHYGEYTIAEAKTYLAQQGIKVL
ncbi:MAG TPA: imidazole glycerol phosphate synthase subunit HisF [Paenalcaligenes hominis]|uniref:Imidazole glycerol phosphate synthase subunit HisF n=1 Tax=Paenalcaligenes hominis TaxID=643674 RepID=A0A9D3ABV2_9BURK|nr:imidazole glycerol phosphate synthase subunit HisF [Paenalcaligenes hominis]